MKYRNPWLVVTKRRYFDGKTATFIRSYATQRQACAAISSNHNKPLHPDETGRTVFLSHAENPGAHYTGGIQ